MGGGGAAACSGQEEARSFTLARSCRPLPDSGGALIGYASALSSAAAVTQAVAPQPGFTLAEGAPARRGGGGGGVG